MSHDNQNSVDHTLDKMPENITIDQVIDQFIFLEKVQNGLDDSTNGRIKTKDQAKEKLNKWFK